MSVTIVLSGFKRPHVLRQQYGAIKSQSVGDLPIILWVNLVDNNINFDPEIINNCQSIISNTNYGVWGRFTAALNANTKYVCVIDDDTIPGKRWIENCLTTMQTHVGVLSTRGVIADKNHDLQYPLPISYKAVGWCDPNETVTRVDMGCHSWFFERGWLRAFWSEMPETMPMRYGEDMHLSYSVKKHLGLNTYIPPHPINNKELWGSMPDTGLLYGEEPVAASLDNAASMGMYKYWNFIRSNGYQTIADEAYEQENEIHDSTK